MHTTWVLLPAKLQVRPPLVLADGHLFSTMPLPSNAVTLSLPVSVGIRLSFCGCHSTPSLPAGEKHASRDYSCIASRRKAVCIAMVSLLRVYRGVAAALGLLPRYPPPSPVNIVALPLRVVELDDPEEKLFVLRAEYSVRHLP